MSLRPIPRHPTGIRVLDFTSNFMPQRHEAELRWRITLDKATQKDLKMNELSFIFARKYHPTGPKSNKFWKLYRPYEASFLWPLPGCIFAFFFGGSTTLPPSIIALQFTERVDKEC